jgi:hypothetical protein
MADNILGTLRQTENGRHTWVTNTTIEQSIKAFKRLGDVRRRGNYLTLTRFCGAKVSAKFFPCDQGVS